jgi:hypothetical protein
MTNAEVTLLLAELVAISPEAADRDELGRAVELNAKVQRFTAHYAVRCSRRANELNREGRSEDGFALLANETGSPREAKATGERDRVCNEMPVFDDALASGAVSTEHLDALARHTKGLTDEQREAVRDRATELAASATEKTAWLFERDAKNLIAEIKAQTRPNSDAEELERQRQQSGMKRWTETDTGVKCTLIKLDPISDSAFHQQIDARARALRNDPANTHRSFEQLRAQAAVELVTGTAAAPGEPPAAPIVNVHVDAQTATEGRHEHTLCELDDGTPIPVATMQRFCCEAILNAVIVEPDGSVRRLAEMRVPNRAQRRALAAMYATCANPECTVPFTQCKIHHVVWFTRRGPTLIANLVPLCERHHHEVHEGGWSLSIDADRHLTWTRPDGTVWRTHHSPNRQPRTDRPPGERTTAA